MKKKAVLFALIILFLAGIILPSGSPVHAAKKVELKFWHAMTRHREKVLNELIERFNKTHPDIKVTPVQIKSRDPRMGNNYNALYKKILENLARKTPPDVSQVYENWVCQLIDIGVIIPVGNYVGKPDGIPKSEIEDLVPVFREANSYQGKLWTLPFNKSIYVLYYNKGIFKSVGAQPPKTWDDFKQVAKKLTKRQGKNTIRYAIAFRPSVDLFGHYLYAYGGDFISGNKAVFNSSVGIKDLQFWVDMVHKDRTALASFNDRRDFMAQKSAMYIDTTSRIGTFKRKVKFNWGVAMLPKGTTRKYSFAGTNLAIFSHLSLEKKKAAIQFVRFMSSKESTIYWALSTGYLPVKKSAINSPQYKAQLKKDPRYKVGVEALKYAKVQPKVAAWEMIRGIVDDAMFDAISLRNTPQEALIHAVKLANHLIRNISGMAQ